MKRIPFVFSGIFICLWLIACASQKDIAILDERMMVIERQNQEVQKRIKTDLASSQGTESTLRSQYAGINADMEKIQQDIRLLSGRMDEISYVLDRKVATSEGDLKTRLDRMEERLAQIERYLNLDASGGKGKTPVGPKSEGAVAGDASANVPKELTADQLYTEAKEAFDAGQIEKSRKGFQQLLKTYPKSENADNAQFWIGETYFNEKFYEKAILEYQVVVEKFPKGNKAPAAMLKQGYAFIQLNDKANARLVLKEIGKKYPKSNEAKIAAEKLKEL